MLRQYDSTVWKLLDYRLSLLILLFLSCFLLLFFTIDPSAKAEAVPAIASEDMTIAAGAFHTLYIDNSGKLRSWGKNNQGELGDGSYSGRIFPVQVGTGDNWVGIGAGYEHSIGLQADGTLWAWGDNVEGELGNGTFVGSNVPIQVGTDSDWAGIYVSLYHTLALKEDGSLWAWGYNSHGQLGIGNTVNSNIPLLVTTDVVTAAAGQYHSLAIRSDGSLWAWGINTNYQLGDGTQNNSTVPIRIGTDDSWASVSGGAKHSLALKNDGTMWSWGINESGELGSGTLSPQFTPQQIGSAADWSKISANLSFSLALNDTGSLWSWGSNPEGALGNGTMIDELSPILITYGPWSAIDGGYYHSMGSQQDLSIWVWGDNDYGQLGNGTYLDSLEPDNVCYDTTAPENPTIGSNSHAVGVFSSDDTIDINLGNATDDICGIAGYSYMFSEDPDVEPGTLVNISAESVLITSSNLSNGSWYFGLRTVDKSGNWSNKTVIGPFMIDKKGPITYIKSGPKDISTTSDVHFYFTAVDNLASSSDIRYIYRLVGSDDIWSQPAASSSATFENLEDGQYVFEIISLDDLGNLSDNSVKWDFQVKTPTTIRYEENDALMVYTNNCWQRYSNESLSGGQAYIAKKTGCRVKFEFSGARIDVRSAKARQLGKMRVYVDKVLQSTVNLYSKTTLADQVVYSGSFVSSAVHTLELEATGSKDSRAINSYILLDDIDVIDSSALPDSNDLVAAIAVVPTEPVVGDQLDVQVEITDYRGLPIRNASVSFETFVDLGIGFDYDNDLCPIFEDVGLISDCGSQFTDVSGLVNYNNLPTAALKKGNRIKFRINAVKSGYDPVADSSIISIY